MKTFQLLCFAILFTSIFQCKPKEQEKKDKTQKVSTHPLAGSLEWLNDEMDQFFDKSARPEVLAGDMPGQKAPYG
jgi:hypothetical protein